MGVKEDLGDTRPYWKVLVSLVSVSYTHLDVYKRQMEDIAVQDAVTFLVENAVEK